MAPSIKLTVGFVPGVTPGKWLGRWRERHPQVPLEAFASEPADQLAILHTGRADLSFVRLPVGDDELHVIPLYAEQPVVLGSKEHEISLFDEVDLDDLDGPFIDPVDVGGEAMAIEIAASGAGLVILPMSIARLHHRKDVVFRPVTGVEQTRIGLAWLKTNDSELVEEFVGIVRGRTANSSRQPSGRSAAPNTVQHRASSPRTAGAKPSGRKPTGASKRSRGKGRGHR